MGLRRLILVSLSGFRNRSEETRAKLGRYVDLVWKNSLTCQKTGRVTFFSPSGWLPAWWCWSHLLVGFDASVGSVDRSGVCLACVLVWL